MEGVKGMVEEKENKAVDMVLRFIADFIDRATEFTENSLLTTGPTA